MARTDSLEHFLTDAAAAIRLKSGTSAQMNPNEMINTINGWLKDNLSNYMLSEVDASSDKGYTPISAMFFHSVPLSYWEYLKNQLYNGHQLYMSNFHSLADFNIANLPYDEELFTTLLFQNCRNIKNINLKDLNYQNVLTIGAFHNCKSVQTIVLPSSLTKQMDIEYYSGGVFDNCHNLIKIEGLEDLDLKTDNNNINLATFFENCYSLANFDFLSTWKNINKTNNCYGMLRSAYEFSSINVFNNLLFSNCNSMSYMFANTNIPKLENLILNFYNAKTCSYMFDGTNITSIDGLNMNICNVVNAALMFSNCQKLQTVTLSTEFDMNAATSAWGMFNNCRNLTSIWSDGSGRPRWSSLTNARNMFKDCRKLEYISGMLIFSLPWGGLTDISSMFDQDNNLSPGTISYVIQQLSQATNVAYKNLHPRNQYSPFYNTNINFANSNYVNNVIGMVEPGWDITGDELLALKTAGWGGINLG